MGHDRQDATGGFTAVVLAGGSASRFGGDKLAVRVGGVSLFDRVVAAVREAREIIAVGAERPAHAPLTWVREEPPGSGPANAIVAALPRVRTGHVVVVAADLPFIEPDTVRRLLAAATPAAVLEDTRGRQQYLCSAFVTDALRTAAGDVDWADRSVRALLAPLSPRSVAAEGQEARDVDAPEDVPSEP